MSQVSIGPLPIDFTNEAGSGLSGYQYVYDSGYLADGISAIDLTFSIGLAGNLGAAVECDVWTSSVPGTSLTPFQSGTLHPGAGTTYHAIGPCDAGTKRILAACYGALPVGTTCTGTLNGNYTTGWPFCEYGTRPQLPTTGVVLLDMGLLSTIAAYFAIPELLPVLLLLTGTEIAIVALCAGPRPDPNVLLPVGLPALNWASTVVQAYLWDAF